MTIITSWTTWLIVLGWVSTIGNAIVPVVPASVGGIITTIATVAAIIVHSRQIKAGAVK